MTASSKLVASINLLEQRSKNIAPATLPSSMLNLVVKAHTGEVVPAMNRDRTLLSASVVFFRLWWSNLCDSDSKDNSKDDPDRHHCQDDPQHNEVALAANLVD